MANVENVSDDELPPMNEEEEEDGEIPTSPQRHKVVEDLSDVRCGVPLHSGKFCYICTLMDSDTRTHHAGENLSITISYQRYRAGPFF